jgi:hypothetical protein
LLAAVFCFGPAAHAAVPDLYANYTTSCTFSVVNDSGASVSSLASGDYQLVVQTPFDFAAGGASCDHVSFQMTGPGVTFATALGGGDADYETYPLVLQPNSAYVLQDTQQGVQVTLTTTSAVAVATPSPTTTSGSTSSAGSSSTKAKGTASSDLVGSALLPLRGTLTAAVSASGRLSLTQAGKAITQLKAGRYAISAKDASKTAGFTLQEIHKPAQAITGDATIGSKKVTVTLRAGQWYFYSRGGVKHYFFVIV